MALQRTGCVRWPLSRGPRYRQTGRTVPPARPRPRRSCAWVSCCRRACTLRPGRTGWSSSPGARIGWSWNRRDGRWPPPGPGAWPRAPSNSRTSVRTAWSSCRSRCAWSTGPPAAWRTFCPLQWRRSRRWPIRSTSTSPTTGTTTFHLHQHDHRNQFVKLYTSISRLTNPTCSKTQSFRRNMFFYLNVNDFNKF